MLKIYFWTHVFVTAFERITTYDVLLNGHEWIHIVCVGSELIHNVSLIKLMNSLSSLGHMWRTKYDDTQNSIKMFSDQSVN